MKKLVFAAMAAILAGGLVSAQDAAAAATTTTPTVKVSGGFMSGFAVNKDGDDDATISVWNTDIQNAGRAYINLDLTGDGYGFSAQLRGQAKQLKASTAADTDSSTGYTTSYGLDMPYFKWVYGYADLFKSVLPVTVKGGFLYEDIWGVGYEGLGYTYGYLAGPAVVVNIKPLQIKGLEFGAGIMDLGTSTSDWSKAEFSSDYLTIGAKYTMDKVFALGAQYKFGNGIDGWSGESYTDGALIASVSLDCVKNLTLSAEGEITSITTDDQYYLYDEYASYQFTDKLSADIIAMQFVTDKIYTFEPTVSYSITDNVSVKLAGGDFITLKDDSTDNDWFVMPGVTLKAGKAKIDLSYAYATSGAPAGGYNYYYYSAGSNIMLSYKFTF
ncbi:MAG TPA: hypothetical protein DCL73_13545 [Treponema sp.]|nr:hypothetical protein [Treponema sp.]